MRPIPLTSPEGVIYGYACGICHNVPASGTMARQEEGPDAYLVENRRQQAESCCTCRRCGALTQSCFVSTCLPCDDILRKEHEAQRKQHVEDQRQANAVVLASLKSAKSLGSAMLLRQRMRDLSEDHFAAGWLMGLERMLWNALHGEKTEEAEFTASELEEIRRLHERAGGWWRWQEGVGEVFVPTDVWLASIATLERVDPFDTGPAV